MKTIFENDSKYVSAGILSLALILATIIWGIFFASNRPNANTLSVTGSAKQVVTSDLAQVTIAIDKTIPQSMLGSGYAQMTSDAEAVKAYLQKQGADMSKVVVTPVMTMKMYDNNNQYAADPRYELRQTIEYQSNNVEQVTNLSKSITTLSNQGILVSIDSVQYFYSKLADLRVSLLGDAVKDAKARAEKIAESAGGRLGAIQSAASGVVQVSAVNSVDVNDYGNYDTSHIDKEVAVTVKATFSVH